MDESAEPTDELILLDITDELLEGNAFADDREPCAREGEEPAAALGGAMLIWEVDGRSEDVEPAREAVTKLPSGEVVGLTRLLEELTFP